MTKQIAVFDVICTIHFRGVTQIDNVPTVTPTIVVDKLHDLLDGLVTQGLIQGLSISYEQLDPSTHPPKAKRVKV